MGIVKRFKKRKCPLCGGEVKKIKREIICEKCNLLLKGDTYRILNPQERLEFLM
jgi:ribosomal protein L37AE/L43A